MLEPQVVYIDESGNDGMDLSAAQVSPLYVVVALLVKQSQLNTCLSAWEATRQKYFRQTPEMKSSHIRNDTVREAVCQALGGTAFEIYGLVVDKARLTSVGFQFPLSFTKFLYARLCRSAIGRLDDVTVYHDQLKSREFTTKLRTYLDRELGDNLFQRRSFCPVASTSHIGVQAADVIAGTIRMCFETNRDHVGADRRLSGLRERIQLLEVFPRQPLSTLAPLPGNTEHDAAIEAQAMDDALRFLGEHAASDDRSKRMQVAVLREMIRPTANSDDWIPTASLRTAASVAIESDVPEQALRQTIGRLRDAGMLIASRSAGGYRLATSVVDMVESLNVQKTQLGPMVSRVDRAREGVRRATNQQLDILSLPGLEDLRRLSEAKVDWKISELPEEETN